VKLAGEPAPHPPPGAAGPLLAVERLHVWFDLRDGGELHAVQGIDLTVARGTRLGLVGESGCGKSSAMLALMGLLPASASVAGRVVLDGSDIMADGERSVRPHRWRDIAMVFQGAMNAFNPVRTIAWQIAEPLRRHLGGSNREVRARVLELLDLVGIPSSRADRYPHELSGGMRQRASIAMALSCEPKVLLADEPTTALDVMVQAQILELLVSLTDELGMALLLVSHDLPVVAQVCDRVAVMYAGAIVEQAPIAELFAEPRHPYSRALLEATPDLTGEGEVVSIPGAPPRLDRPLSGCAFAPRCGHAFERCERESPELVRATASDRAAACHLVTPGDR
jgi:peptide/nickel transport system ATP-binding protein